MDETSDPIEAPHAMVERVWRARVHAGLMPPTEAAQAIAALRADQVQAEARALDGAVERIRERKARGEARMAKLWADISARLERQTAYSIYRGHKRLARGHLRQDPRVPFLSPRAMRIVARWERMHERRAALEEAA